MLSSLWKYISGALALVVGLLGAGLIYTGGQKERAKEAATVAKANARSQQAVREVERSIDNARAKARADAVEVEHEQLAHRSASTRPRVFGDSRLRDDKNGTGST